MSKLGAPFAIFKWLLAGEKLDSAPIVVRAAKSEGFWRWLFTSEELPEIDPLPVAGQHTGLLRFIFSSDRLPQPSAAGNDLGSAEDSETPRRSDT